MQYQSSEHRNKFKSVMKAADREQIKNLSKYEACCYILTCDNQVWNMAKPGIKPDGVYFDSIYINDAGVIAYTLIKCAGDIYCGTGYTTVFDLCETEELNPKLLKTILTAIVMNRYGSKKTL